MAGDDLRYYETFYGIYTNDWEITFGSFTDSPNLLVKEYISDACDTTDYSIATDTAKFIYPHHIKKIFFIEGVIEGHITVASSSATSTVTDYKVTVGKVHEDTSVETDLFTTGWITVNTTLTWDSTYSIGEEIVYPFWIDAWDYAEISDKERIYVKIEVNGDNNCVLWHRNDATWEDLKITIPLRL